MAHCWVAPSIWRRLFRQAFFCEVIRALMKLGIAMAANKPMMATNDHDFYEGEPGFP